MSMNVFIKEVVINEYKNEFLQSFHKTSSYSTYKSIIDNFISFHINKDSVDFIVSKKDSIYYLDEALMMNSKYKKKSIYTQKTYVNVIKRFLKLLYNNMGDMSVYYLIQYLEEHRRLDLDSIDIKPLSYKDFMTVRNYLESQKPERFFLDHTKTIEENKTEMFQSFIKMRNMMALKLVVFAGIKSEEIKTLRINGIKKLKKSYEFELLIHRGKKKYEVRKTKMFMHHIRDEVLFLKQYFAAFGTPDNLIMVSSRNLEYSICNKDISYFVSKFFEKTQVKIPSSSKVGFYLLRHSYGLYLAKNGKHIQTIRKKMGLVKTDMAKLYVAYLKTNNW